jgi:hypothetical protein
MVTFPIREGDYLSLWESYPEIKGEIGPVGPVGVKGPEYVDYFEHLKKSRLEKISLIKSLFNS